MKVEPTGIQARERKIWQLILVAIVVILYLTLSMLGVFFIKFLGESEFIIFGENLYEYSVFLVILILLFCAYMVIQQKKMLQLSRSLLKEQESAYHLSEDMKILSSLFEVSSSINSQKKVSDILTTITKDMLTCFEADHSSIMLLDKETRMLKTMASVGRGAERAKDALVPLGEGIAGWVLKNGKPLLLNGQVDPAQFPGADKKERRIRLQTVFEQLHSPEVIKKLVKKIDERGQPDKLRERIYSRYRDRVTDRTVVINSQDENTLFFDYLPMDLVTVRDHRLRVQFYTVPGQVKYEATRRLVLHRMDGVVFVADSMVLRREKNVLSLKSLQENLAAMGAELSKTPLVFQYNKRDLALEGIPILGVDTLQGDLNGVLRAPYFEACAKRGEKVIPTMNKILSLTVESLRGEMERELRFRAKETGIPAQVGRPSP